MIKFLHVKFGNSELSVGVEDLPMSRDPEDRYRIPTWETGKFYAPLGHHIGGVLWVLVGRH